jgi:hypothetical protein
MALRLFRAGAAGLALMAASMAGVGAQTSVNSGPARSVDLRTAPVLQTPPMPAIDFDRPTPRCGMRCGMTAHRAAQRRGASQTKRLPPETARDRQ